MADGAITLTLDDETVRRRDEAARRAGVTPEAYAAGLLSAVVTEEAGETPLHDWTEANRRLAEYDRTGEFVEAGPALDAFVAEVRARTSQRT